MKTFTKQPNELLDYEILYEEWLGGDTIQDAQAVIDSQLITIADTTFSDTSVKVWLEDGLDGDKAVVTVTIQTMLGRRKETEFRIKIKEI